MMVIFHHDDRRLVVVCVKVIVFPSSESTGAECLPRVERLAAPYPHPGRDTYDQGHKQLEHVHLHRGD